MKVIRASELGTYQFCNRAWWYQLQGIEPENQLALSTGSDLHTRHYYKVTAAGCMQTIAVALAVSAILLIIIYLAQNYL